MQESQIKELEDLLLIENAISFPNERMFIVTDGMIELREDVAKHFNSMGHKIGPLVEASVFEELLQRYQLDRLITTMIIK